MKSAFLLVMTIVAFSMSPLPADAQEFQNDTLNRWLAGKKMEGANPYFESVNIAQIEDTRSLNIVVSQVRVLRSSGGWTGPLWEGFVYVPNNLRPVFQYNSYVYADSIVTEPFSLFANDTLNYKVYLDFIFPPTVTDRDSAIYGIKFIDSLEYIIDLVDTPTNHRLVRLDSIRFIAADSLKDWFGNIMRYAIDHPRGNIVNQKYIGGAEFIGQSVRLRLLINFMGPYSRRWIERSDGWERFVDMDRDSMYAEFMQDIAEELCQIVDWCDSIPKAAFRGSSKVGVPVTLEIFPSPMRGMSIVKIGPIPSRGLNLEVYNASGRMLSAKEIAVGMNSIYIGEINMMDLPSGTYYVVAKMGQQHILVGKVIHAH